jgi:enoyl-[acyl-carrier protein] reductase/trans-2-enoyl-CoA reductase (NAD+)
MDDWELSDAIQAAVVERWPIVSTATLPELADLEGIRGDFLKIFGFGVTGVDYDADIDPTLGRASS